jgi:hypothetical protein
MGRQRDGGRRAVSLRLTPLEDRTLPTSGVTASLSGGILRITDRAAADTLVVQQTPTGVTVTATGVNQAFTAVNQIMADVQNTDTVTNDVSGLSGTSARSLYLSRRDPTGATFVASGNLAAGASSSPGATTTPPPAAPPTGSTTSASGVTATLTAGVLRITDRLAGDLLAARQTPTGVSLTATGTSLTFSAVTQIMADVQNTVTVTNDVSGLNGTAARSLYLSRRNPTGATFVSSGNLAAGASSGPAVAATPPSNPTPPTGPSTGTDWFDLMLTDAGVRSLARTVSGDGVIDRQDVLALFTEIEQNGTVTANEIHDLDVLENPDWTAGGATPKQAALFTMPAPVRGLLSDVVDGDPANATYQGATLGNLKAGSTSAQLQKLVNKWFLGLDHPTAPGTYTQMNGTLFATGPAVTDVQQGDLSDCYLLAALQALAKENPAAITSMFTNNGDGTYTVRFYDAGVAKYVTVDSMLPTDSGGKLIYDGAGASAKSTSNVLWVALAEKAYAQINQDGWLDRPAANSYPAIEEGFSDDALTEITGGNTTWTQIVQATTTQLQAAVTAGKPAILNSLTSPGNGVIGSHTYPVVAYNPTTQQFTLDNPQGGSIQLTWTQITQSFSGFWQMT